MKACLKNAECNIVCNSKVVEVSKGSSIGAWLNTVENFHRSQKERINLHDLTLK